MFIKTDRSPPPYFLDTGDGGGGGGGGDDAAAAAEAAAAAAAATTWHKDLPEDIRADPSLVDFKDETEMISMPIGVLTALFIAKIAPKRVSEFLRTVVELLASIPSIVYGLFGSGVILVFVYNLAALFGIQSKGGNSVLATVLVLALMTLPTITAISEVSIRSVDKDIELGSLALGATKTQTNFKVILTSAKSGIFASAILGIGRALGEATAVSLVAGNAKSGPSLGIFDITSTLTSTMLEGLKETTGIDYDIRFSVGLVLMVVILLTNLILNYIKKKVGNVDVK